MISNLPQKIIKYLEYAGFSGDRVGSILIFLIIERLRLSLQDYGLRELEKSAFSNGLNAPFSAMFLLSYHAFVIELFGNSDGDLELCHRLVEHYLHLYPNVSSCVCVNSLLANQTEHRRMGLVSSEIV